MRQWRLGQDEAIGQCGETVPDEDLLLVDR
jgi:hypothetical protein